MKKVFEKNFIGSKEPPSGGLLQGRVNVWLHLRVKKPEKQPLVFWKTKKDATVKYPICFGNRNDASYSEWPFLRNFQKGANKFLKKSNWLASLTYSLPDTVGYSFLDLSTFCIMSRNFPNRFCDWMENFVTWGN